VRNNVIMNGVGAGLAFYSARDAVVAHNTLVNVAAKWHAGVLFNVSPKQIWPGREVAASNKNVSFVNNLVVLAPGSTVPMVEMRVMQVGPLEVLAGCGCWQLSPPSTPPQHQPRQARNLMAAAALQAGMLPPADYVAPAAKECAFFTSGRRMLRADVSGRDCDQRRSSSTASAAPPATAATGTSRRRLQQQKAASWAQAVADLPGSAGRNSDGSCQILPPNNAWHQVISALPVHPNSASIKTHIGGGNIHVDFAGVLLLPLLLPPPLPLLLLFLVQVMMHFEKSIVHNSERFVTRQRHVAMSPCRHLPVASVPQGVACSNSGE
jgi:hypothetical protein